MTGGETGRTDAGFGICVCGLNGSGKTTTGRVLAEALGFTAMDVENYYFPPSERPFSSPRTREEVEVLLLRDMEAMPRFVFSAVNGRMRAEIVSRYRLVVYLEVPVEVRIERIRRLAVDRFGARVLPGGDLYEEERFFAFAEKRRPDEIEAWLSEVPCPVLRLDGTKPISENVRRIFENVRALLPPALS